MALYFKRNNLKLQYFVDSDFCGDAENRKLP